MTTLATLLLELSLTRIFSVVFYYHFAFLAISIALFGLGAGGVLSYVVAGWKGNLFTKLGWLSALNGPLVIATLAVVPATKVALGNWQLALIYFAAALPFVVAGTIVSLAISETMESVNRVYFFDLLGAAAGCLLLVPLLNYLGGAGTVLSAGVLFVAGAAVWHSMAQPKAPPIIGAILTIAMITFLVLNIRGNFVGVRGGPNEIYVKWNSFSRIALNRAHDSSPPSIVIDGDASTDIWRFDFDHLSAQDRESMLNYPTALPYLLRPNAKALVIGPGGGTDVINALASGSNDVTGVEINPIIATTIMRQKHPELSGGLYLRPEVHIVVEDGRGYIRRSTEKFGVIQATLVDTWAATAAGAFALSENNLYTSEAFRDYLEHLTGDGVLAFSRWGFEPPRESLRLVSLGVDALLKMGKAAPSRHIIAVRLGDASHSLALDTVIISANPFTPQDISLAENSIRKMEGVTALYLPNREIPNPFTGLLRSANPRDFERSYPFNISPVNDNRPFFFYSVQPADWWRFLSSASHASIDDKVNRAVPLLLELAAISILATIIILALPPLLLGARLRLHAGVPLFLLYFVFIGAGYILIEVALIQKFVLFLGHPTYALTVVIFSLLVSSGLGSYFSRGILQDRKDRWMILLAAVALLAVLLGLAVSFLLTPAVGLPLAWKIAITVLLIAPSGFAMGMPFPMGLKRLEALHPPSVRWAWSLNAASSVMGSVGSLVCAIYFGLLQTLMIGGALYLVALLVVAAPGLLHRFSLRTA
jgi:predicted membrane-bound spermidine synthase